MQFKELIKRKPPTYLTEVPAPTDMCNSIRSTQEDELYTMLSKRQPFQRLAGF